MDLLLTDDECAKRIAVLVRLEVEGFQLVRGQGAFGLVIGLGDCCGLDGPARNRDLRVRIGDLGVGAAFTAVFVLAEACAPSGGVW